MQTTLLVIHVGVVVVAFIATLVSISIAIAKIKKINKGSKKVDATAIIPLNDEDGVRSGVTKGVAKDSMASISPLKNIREQYGAGSREYQTAMMSIRVSGKYWPQIQYSYKARFTMSTDLCIHCSQSFTLEHYIIGSLFERYINRKATKGTFLDALLAGSTPFEYFCGERQT